MTTLEFNHNVNKIESLLFGFAMRLTRNKENAKDLMQETLMRCFDKRNRFKIGTNFKSWATTVMYNSYINHYRKRKTRNKVVKPIEDYNYLVENKSVEGNAYSLIMMKELKNMVGNLKDDCKIPFKMYVEGYQYDEISEQLDIPMGTVKSRIFYARKKIEKYDSTSVFKYRNTSSSLKRTIPKPIKIKSQQFSLKAERFLCVSRNIGRSAFFLICS